MKKRIISLVLALVMCMGLTVPAFAVPVLRSEVDALKSDDISVPQYAVHEVPYTISLQNNTYASIIFSIAEKGGKAYFEERVSISFYTTNPNGSHWKIVKHSYSINEDIFYLYITAQDMEGDKPSSDYWFENVYAVLPSQVAGYNLSAEDRSGVVLAPVSVSVRFAEEVSNTLATEDGDGILLTPIRMNVRYVGDTENVNCQVESY